MLGLKGWVYIIYVYSSSNNNCYCDSQFYMVGALSSLRDAINAKYDPFCLRVSEKPTKFKLERLFYCSDAKSLCECVLFSFRVMPCENGRVRCTSLEAILKTVVECCTLNNYSLMEIDPRNYIGAPQPFKYTDKDYTLSHCQQQIIIMDDFE